MSRLKPVRQNDWVLALLWHSCFQVQTQIDGVKLIFCLPYLARPANPIAMTQKESGDTWCRVG